MEILRHYLANQYLQIIIEDIVSEYPSEKLFALCVQFQPSGRFFLMVNHY